MRVTNSLGMLIAAAVICCLVSPVMTVSLMAADFNKPGDLKGHPAEMIVQRLLAKNRGPDRVEGENFSPSRSITRAELATLLCRVLPSETTGQRGYTEENSAQRFYRDQIPSNATGSNYREAFGYVETIVRRGYMKAEDGLFKPEANVTGGEFLQILLRVLQDVTCPYLNMPDVADSAASLNRHLTRYKDVSLPAHTHPGWVRIAENYTILPAIPGDTVNSFDATKPVSRALACAVISNLFIKWDACYFEVPFGREIGNRSLLQMYRSVDGNTVTDAELVEVAPGRKTFSVKYKKRELVKMSEKIMRTTYADSTEILTLGENAIVRVFSGQEGKCYNCPQALAELESYLRNRRTHHIYRLGVNFLTLPKSYRLNEDEYGSIFNEVGERIEVRQIEYMEVFLIPYDIQGRILAKNGNTMDIKDLEHGVLTVEFHPGSTVSREIISDPVERIPDAADTFVKPENGVIYAKPWDALKVGETIHIKLSTCSASRVKVAQSWLRRIGVPSNVDLVERKLRTLYHLDKFYQCDGKDWEHLTGKGLILWRFTGDPDTRYWTPGGIGSLFESWSRLREVDLYVQPEDTFLGTLRVEVPHEQRIQFIEAVAR